MFFKFCKDRFLLPVFIFFATCGWYDFLNSPLCLFALNEKNQNRIP